MFANTWFSSAFPKEGATITLLDEVKDFARETFDSLDKDNDGYLHVDELEMALDDDSLSERDKSFVTFLLDNRKEIATSFDEGWASKKDGISKYDLESYFAIVARRMHL
ncbi:MAG TPA: hypothetical protein V6D17_03590 [Candidatus Obscuribacterales bacterium]